MSLRLKFFDDLKRKVEDQDLKIKSIKMENARLRSENVEQQRKIDEGEIRRKVRAS